MLFRYISRQASRRVSILRSPLAKESTTGFVPKFIKFQTKAFASSSLSDLIQREIADESQNELNEMPSHLSDLHKQISSNWTIVDGSSVGSNSGAVVNMYKKEALENGAKVTVSFHCQDTMELDGLSEMLDEDDDFGEESPNPLRFEVKVSKAGMNMCIACESDEGKATVDGITFDEEGVDEGDTYRGPVLEELDKDFQAELEIFLKEICGINDDLSAFLPMYSDYREQLEYVKWLENFNKVVS